MSDVQMFWSLCAECVEFLSQRRSDAVLMESRHAEGQTDKQGLYQRKRITYVIMRCSEKAWKPLRKDRNIDNNLRNEVRIY